MVVREGEGWKKRRFYSHHALRVAIWFIFLLLVFIIRSLIVFSPFFYGSGVADFIYVCIIYLYLSRSFYIIEEDTLTTAQLYFSFC